MNRLNFKFLLSLFLLFSAFAHAGEGGIDGGGGGTIPVTPSTPEEVTNVILNAKRDLRLFSRFDQKSFGAANSNDLQRLLYGERTTLLDLIESTDIEIEQQEPCFDAFHSPVDGSIHAKRPGSICISVFRIAPKLEHGEGYPQIIALILHELSHLLGANEAQAIEYQRKGYALLRKATQDSAIIDLTAIRDETIGLRQISANILSNMDSMSDDDLGVAFSRITNRMDTLEHTYDNEEYGYRSGSLDNSPFSALTKKERDFFHVAWTIQELSFMYLKSFVPGQEGYLGQLDEIFEGKDSMPFSRWRNQYSHMGPNSYDSFEIRRVRNRTDLKATLTELNTYFTALDAEIEALLQNTPFPKL